MAGPRTGIVSESDRPTEAEAVDNASVAGPNLARMRTLEERNLERIVEEPNWHDEGSPDFQQRLVSNHHYFPDCPAEGHRPITYAKSHTSSLDMAVSVQSMPLTESTALSYTPSSRPPSLVSKSTAQSRSSARTSRADSVILHQPLEVDEDGTLREPEPEPELYEDDRLHCCFWYLSCSEQFDDFVEWDTHCQSHLYGFLPPKAQCPFYCDWTTTGATGDEAWRARREHIEDKHPAGGLVDTTSRPDTALLQHMWNKKIIDNAQLKELRQHGCLTGHQVFMTSAGLNERRRDRPRTSRRP